MKRVLTKGKKRKIALILAVIFLVTPFVAYPLPLIAGDYVYVDDDVSDKMDGSSKHPFDSIQRAIDKASNRESKAVYVKKGTYEENVEIWEDIEVVGEDKENVIIKARNEDKEVVKMHDDAILRNVTVKDGERGIEIKGGAEATVKNCIIKNNDKDGIKIKSAEVDDKNEVDIRENTIEKNGWNGIYSESRKIVIKDNEIKKNGRDGVEIASGSEALIEDNRFEENDGDGLRLTIDGSEIWVDDDTFYDNGREGLEVRSFGADGSIQVKSSKFYKNDRYGIARIGLEPFGDRDWNDSLYVKYDNKYWENDWGDFSNIIKIF